MEKSNTRVRLYCEVIFGEKYLGVWFFMCKFATKFNAADKMIGGWSLTFCAADKMIEDYGKRRKRKCLET